MYRPKKPKKSRRFSLVDLEDIWLDSDNPDWLVGSD